MQKLLLLCEQKASARSRVGCVLLQQAMQCKQVHYVVRCVPLLLSLLLLGSNSRGKGDQCRDPRERISHASMLEPLCHPLQRVTGVANIA